MWVVTADQVASRSSPDQVEDALRLIESVGGARLSMGPERTVGDEVQMATDDAAFLIEAVLALNRSGAWSIGAGAGPIEPGASTSIRAARGPAFIAAREAVEAAKKRPTRFAVRAPAAAEAAADAQALSDLLLALRARRTDEGWEVVDLLATGTTQKAIAARLGISVQAVSLRARAAHATIELEAVPALVRAFERAGRARP